MRRAAFLLLIPVLVAGPALAGIRLSQVKNLEHPESVPCCEHRDLPGVVWYGGDSLMTASKMAALVAPILWYSPDEPLLQEADGKEIMIPEPFPFEGTASGPVSYYRVRTVKGGVGQTGAWTPDPEIRGEGVIDLDRTNAVEIDFFFYYSSEEGLGAHEHDVESTEFQLAIWELDHCEAGCRYAISVPRVNAKAHGLLWYDNTLEIDKYAVFPMTILVEEGKHASCTDKNGDGYYTPGFDVNKRVNDAWGIRDVMRGGALFTGGFQSWFVKVRTPDHRVFPPLPEDSPLRYRLSGDDGTFAPENAVYELRPFPHPDEAAADPHLVPFIADKGDPDWPEVDQDTALKDLGGLFDGENFAKSLSVAVRTDGDWGVSFVFPLLIFKNIQDPMGGGWIMNRLYFKDKKLRDVGWNILYSPSASRWIDGYAAFGVEWDYGESRQYLGADWMFETGIKFRANINHSPLRFMSKFGTDFWGLRMGLKAKGLLPVNEWAYVLELGAGSF